MRLSASPSSHHHLISHYDQYSFTINQQIISQSLLLTQSNITLWSVSQPYDLNTKNIEPWFQSQPEIILLGTGQTFTPAPIEVIEACRAQNIGFDIMSTPSACRSYNILAEEGRRVLAALIIGSPS